MAKKKKVTGARIDLIAAAVIAIEAVYEDSSVDYETSIGDLNSLISRTEECIEALKCDIRNRDLRGKK